VFDKPEGRIVEAEARGAAAPAARDLLTAGGRDESGSVTVRFSLVPE
jgi:hypothetical protein